MDDLVVGSPLKIAFRKRQAEYETISDGLETWRSLHEKVVMFAAGPISQVSAVVKNGDQYSILIDGKVQYAELEWAGLWAISSDGKLIAAAIGKRSPSGTSYSVAVRELSK